MQTFFKRPYLIAVLVVGFAVFSGVSLAAGTLTAQNKAVTIIEDTVSKTVPLSITGSRGETFTVSIVTPPAHGSAVVNDKTIVYIPQTHYNGSDIIEYQALGSISGLSNVAVVTITIVPKNDAPVANSGLAMATSKNISVTGAVSGTDIDGDTLSCYSGIAGNGYLTMDSATCTATFIPENNFVGDAWFNFRVYDGVAYSEYATVSVNVAASNAAPTASDQTISTIEDTGKTFPLLSQDADFDALTHRVLTDPAHGTVTINDTEATYTPAANYNGSDSFQFAANDGLVDSNTATVSITISAVNDAPFMTDATYTMAKNQRTTITLAATDVEGAPLAYGISTVPTNGRVNMISENTVEYAPAEDFVGTDSFQYWASDGTAYPRATVTVVVSETATAATGVGELVWEYDFGPAIISGAPAFDDNGHIYFGSFRNVTEVYMMDRYGQLLDRLNISMHVEAAPLVLGDQLILNTIGTLDALGDDPSQTVLGGVTFAQRLGTVSIGLDSDGSFDDSRVWGNRSETYGRDGSPGQNEDGSIIYAADIFKISDNNGGTPRLVSIDSATGETLQQVTIPGWSYSSPLFLPNTETVSQKDGLVVLGPEVDDGDPTIGGFGGLGGSGVLLAYAVDEYGVMTDTPVWSVASDSAFDRGASAATIDGETLLFTGTQNGIFYAIRPEDGSVVWSVETGASGFGTVTVGDDNRTVYAAVSMTNLVNVPANPIFSSLIAFDGVTGEIQWTHTIQNKSATPVVGDRGVYVVGEYEVLAVNEQGEELWSLPLSDEPYYGYASLMPETGLLVFGAGTKMIAVQTESTGPSTVSDWPSYRGTHTNSGVPQ